MTDAFPPDDELISSYLDGEATPDQIARIEASPELMARASDLRAAIRLTATPVSSPDGTVVDEMIAASLNAGGVPDNITDLATARPRSIPKPILAAAAVVLVALSIPAIRLISGSSTGSDSASAPAAMAESATGVAADSLDGGDSASKAFEQSAATTVAAATAPALDFAPADLAESTGVDETGLAPDAVRLAIPGLPPFDKEIFDPLPAVLSPVSDLTSLEVILIAALSNTPQPAPEGPVPSTLTDLNPLLCSDSIAAFLESNPIGAELATLNAVADFAQVEIGGALHWLSLIRLSPTRTFALVVNVTTCTPVTLINLAP